MRFPLSAIAVAAVLSACSTHPPPAEDPLPATPRPATTAAQVLAYLASLPLRPDHRLLSGQNIGHESGAIEGYERFVTALRTETGHAPAFVSVDYSSGSLDAQAIRDINRVLIAHWKHGGLVSVNLASLNSPFTGGNCKDRDRANLRDLLTPGTRGFAAWSAALEIVAAGLAELRDAGVVVLFRPLHEMNLSEFWWGRAPQAVFWWHWHSWGLSRMALVDQDNVGEALTDPWVVNRDEVEVAAEKR